MDLLPHQQRALTGLKFLFGLLLLGFVLWLLVGCSKGPQHIDPPREPFLTSLDAQKAAFSRVVLALGQHVAGPTHGTSMQPLIYEGSWVITQERAFNEVRVGRIYQYSPKPGADFPSLVKDYNSSPVHRAVMQDAGGFLMSGDSAPVSDSSVRMTAGNMLGEVIWIGSTPKP